VVPTAVIAATSCTTDPDGARICETQTRSVDWLPIVIAVGLVLIVLFSLIRRRHGGGGTEVPPSV
jgi:hypothetical protein